MSDVQHIRVKDAIRVANHLTCVADSVFAITYDHRNCGECHIAITDENIQEMRFISMLLSFGW